MNIPIKKGMLIRNQGHLFFVEELNERHTGQQKPTVHVKLKDLRDGHHVERKMDELLPLQEVQHTYRLLQYTYAKPGTYVFMDTQSFEEYELHETHLHGFEPFLREGLEIRAMFADERPVMLDLPPWVLLHVTATAAPEHAVGQSGSVLKDAVMENNLTVKVPLFIKNGDLLRVNTRDRTYSGKEKEE